MCKKNYAIELCAPFAMHSNADNNNKESNETFWWNRHCIYPSRTLMSGTANVYLAVGFFAVFLALLSSVVFFVFFCHTVFVKSHRFAVLAIFATHENTPATSKQVNSQSKRAHTDPFKHREVVAFFDIVCLCDTCREKIHQFRAHHFIGVQWDNGLLITWRTCVGAYLF